MARTTTEGTIAPPDLSQIVNRTSQRATFTGVLERLRSGMPFQHNLLEWYGAPGIGKTTLLALLKNECTKRNTPWVLLDFDKEEVGERKGYKDFASDPILLVNDEILKSLSEYNIDITSVQEDIAAYYQEQLPPEGVCVAYARMTDKERSYSGQAWLKKMQQVVSSLLKTILSLAVKNSTGGVQPFTLFVDGGDNIPELLADWMEEFLVKPLIQSKRCIVVWIARYPWKWKRPELRWDRKSEELPGFQPDEVKQQLNYSPRFQSDHSLAEQLFGKVYSLTGGHPYAGAIVIGEIAQWTDINSATLKQRERELYQEIYTHVIRNYALKDFSTEQSTALELCSMVRLVDMTTLQRILQECAGLMVENWQRKDFDRLLFDLRRTYLLRWEKNGWTVDPSLRHLMRSYYLASAEDTFQRVNLAALKVYQEWLSRAVDNRRLFIVEELYHYISLQQVGIRERELVDILEERLDQYPTEVKDDPKSWLLTLDQIDGAIKHDEEFIRLIGVDAVQQLTVPIESRIKLLDEEKS